LASSFTAGELAVLRAEEPSRLFGDAFASARSTIYARFYGGSLAVAYFRSVDRSRGQRNRGVAVGLID
jgi:hypothetical protein